MAKRKRRTFTPEFKAKVVIEALNVETSQAELCHRHNITEYNSHSESSNSLKSAQLIPIFRSNSRGVKWFPNAECGLFWLYICLIKCPMRADTSVISS